MDDYSVILVEPNNSGNVGAIARSMANFGFKNMILINPRCEIDDSCRDRAKHAQKILDKAKIKKDFDKVIKKFDVVIGTTGIVGNDYNIPRSPVLSNELNDLVKERKGKVALVFGREDDGLSNEEIKKCDFTVTVPVSDDYPVMNLSHAVAIVLYELSKNKNTSDMREVHNLVTKKDKEILDKLVNDLIDKTEFSTEREAETQRRVWKRLLGKGFLTRREAFSLMGFLKKLKKNNNKKS